MAMPLSTAQIYRDHVTPKEVKEERENRVNATLADRDFEKSVHQQDREVWRNNPFTKALILKLEAEVEDNSNAATNFNNVNPEVNKHLISKSLTRILLAKELLSYLDK